MQEIRIRGTTKIRFECFPLAQPQWLGLRPDFLSSLLALMNFMRLSLMKAAHEDVGGAPWQEIRVAPTFSAHVRLGERGAPVLVL